MPVPVIMPQLGESVVEGTISKWHKKEGEKVVRDDPLVEITTDKVNIEVPSPASGILSKVLVQEGETVPVGAKLGVILLEGEKAETEEPAKTEGETVKSKILEEPAVAAELAMKERSEATRYSPAVRRLAREYGVDPDKLQGTGVGGRVTKDDIMAYVERQAEEITEEEFDLNPEFWVKVVQKSVKAEGKTENGEEIIHLSAIRRAIAKQMLKSKREAPHVTTWDEADMSRWVDFLKKHSGEIEKKYNVHMTYMPFIIKAVVYSLKEFPVLNSSLEGDDLKIKKYYNIGVAVARDSGLIVPVVHSADKKSVMEIARELDELKKKAVSDKLTLQDVHEGTFTITNAGGFGALASTPIINFPEVAILGIHKITERPVVVDGEITKRWMMNLCLSFDHRVVDGAPAVQFLHRVKEYLEEPERWLLDLL
ncbi:MAG: dihydrolipoyllysine-residue succinyltransferase [Candidatus Schekmanbacteria bacterium]|nr:dihydrolipoyllysine-residue succinyltransferase [Candidatus Schekmanbacteria bacterium]